MDGTWDEQPAAKHVFWSAHYIIDWLDFYINVDAHAGTLAKVG